MRAMCRVLQVHASGFYVWLRNELSRQAMSQRGNCYDNAVVESFFHLLKTERIQRKTYKTRKDARQDGFDCIELFYNPKRRHANNGVLSPVEFEMATK